MRKIILLLALALAVPVVPTGCTTPPDNRVAAVQTLRAVGLTAKAGLDSAAILLRDGKITVVQYQKVASYYEAEFQTAFRFAVAAARSDLAIASPDIVTLGIQFTALVAQLTSR